MLRMSQSGTGVRGTALTPALSTWTLPLRPSAVHIVAAYIVGAAGSPRWLAVPLGSYAGQAELAHRPIPAAQADRAAATDRDLKMSANRLHERMSARYLSGR